MIIGPSRAQTFHYFHVFLFLWPAHSLLASCHNFTLWYVVEKYAHAGGKDPEVTS